ncbi:hypothetical protein TNCV_2308101 [Trichonephila clavipes]|nr:hypothetical protein TNCV_2308101 [Trichonephila clavipes]
MQGARASFKHGRPARARSSYFPVSSKRLTNFKRPAVATDFDKETDGLIPVDSAANLLEVVGNKRVSVFKDEAQVFKLLPAEEVVVVVVRMGIGIKVSLSIVGNIADVEGMVVEGTSLDVDLVARKPFSLLIHGRQT